jgi:hypothetical protein
MAARDAPMNTFTPHTAARSASRDAALNPHLDAAHISHEFFASNGGIVVIDDMLTAATADGLAGACRLAARADGDLLAADGPSAVVDIAASISRLLPAILGPHDLRDAHASLTHAKPQPGPVAARDAARCLHLWLTPDDANRDPYTGGLIVYSRHAPEDWFETEHNATQARRLLVDADIETHMIDYRQNRAVLFDADLLHEDDIVEFDGGPDNGRLSLVLTFGERI